jgi:hypothetical protein
MCICTEFESIFEVGVLETNEEIIIFILTQTWPQYAMYSVFYYVAKWRQFVTQFNVP